MAIIKSGASSDQLTVDVTSKAARVTLYDTLGVNAGPKRTYRAATVGTFSPANSAAPFFVITGSGTTTVRVQRIVVSGFTIAAVAYNGLGVAKYSTANSGGTATALVQVPLDSASAAGTVGTCSVYTVATTAGTLVGTLANTRFMVQSTTAAAAGIPFIAEFDFRSVSEATSVVLRGVAQNLGVVMHTAAALLTVSVEVEWTEE